MTTSINQLKSQNSTLPILTYYGGKVLNNPTYYSLFLGKYWTTIKGSADQNYFDSFGAILTKSPYVDLWKEYNVKNASFGGSTNILSNTAPRLITQNEIEKIIGAELNNKKILTAGPESVYTVYLPPRTILEMDDGSLSTKGIGGFHKSFQLGKNRIYYAVIVYSKDQNGVSFTSNARDNATIATSHEWTEVATDPDVNAGKLGWYNNQYGEISDIPVALGLRGKQLIDYVNQFAVQKNWSNKDKKFESFPSNN